MRKTLMFAISWTVIALLIFPTGCKKAEEPSKAPAPAVAPAPEQKPPAAPEPAPEKKSEETVAPQKKPPEAPAAKQKAVKPSGAEAPAAAPEKKAPEPAPTAQKEIITEDSIYLAQSTTVESDGLGCADDQSKATMAAMEDGKRNAIQTVMNGIKEKTKSPELKKDLLSAYANATIGNALMLMRACYKDEAKGQCCRTKLKVEVVPDPGKIKSLMK